MANQGHKLSHLAVTVNGKEINLISLDYSTHIHKSLAEVRAVGAVIPDGSDVTVTYQCEGRGRQTDILRNVRQVGGQHYVCDRIEWALSSAEPHDHDQDSA